MVAYSGRSVSVQVPRRPKRANSRTRVFDVKQFLDSTGLGRKVAEFGKKETVFAQGDPAQNVMYIQEGGVKLTVVNQAGKEALVAILGPGDFFGEACLGGQSVCIATATTVAPTTVLVIEKNEMLRVLHAEHEFSDRFIAYMLARNIRVEEDLIDQLFNSSEKRLARTLLLLARYGAPGDPQKSLPKMSQETLSEMIGTTRSRVNFFMNKFRKMGFIHYTNGKIHIDNSLLSVVLHD
jgi:CRP/FNR family transcriptional regulator, cyclic AMP receptor protein